jgi:hypothetical protein
MFNQFQNVQCKNFKIRRKLRPFLFIASIILVQTATSHAAEPYNIDPFLNSLPKWIEQFKASDKTGGYSSLPGKKKPDVYGTSDILYILYTLDKLDLTPQQQSEWSETIRSFQNPKTGWFINTANLHSKEHATAFAVGALKLLGANPTHPLSFAKNFDTPRKIERLLENTQWENIWSGSHIPAGTASSLINTGTVDAKWMDVFLGWLDREVDPATGYWIRGGARKNPSPTTQEMGGAFHFYFLYLYMKRPLPFPEKIIDTTLSLQKPDGLWAADAANFIDLDGIYSLIYACRQTNGYRRADVEAALKKAATSIVTRLNEPALLMKSYTDTHKLVAPLVALAEIQDFMPNLIKTPKPLKRILAVSPFI